jgi:hypothetical protein
LTTPRVVFNFERIDDDPLGPVLLDEVPPFLGGPFVGWPTGRLHFHGNELAKKQIVYNHKKCKKEKTSHFM